jgi:hypothetical protein
MVDLAGVTEPQSRRRAVALKAKQAFQATLCCAPEGYRAANIWTEQA